MKRFIVFIVHTISRLITRFLYLFFNPARGQVVSPQIMFENKINPRKKKNLILVGEKRYCSVVVGVFFFFKGFIGLYRRFAPIPQAHLEFCNFRRLMNLRRFRSPSLNVVNYYS